MRGGSRPGKTVPRRPRVTRQAKLRDGESSVGRLEIIESIIKTLKPLDYVHAFWEGGAAAFGRIDEWSDIDAYLLVDDSKVEDAFLAVERALESVSPIKKKYVVSQNSWPGVSQAFYRLSRASEYLLVDLAILTESSAQKFLEPEIHGRAIFYFNKTGLIEPPRLDKHGFDEKVEERLGVLKERFEMFNNFVQKEMNRGNSLEALEYYRTIVIGSLVEVLRIKYYSPHYDFRMRYIHHELPPEVVKKLESLCFVGGKEELQRKYLEALRWFKGAVLEPSPSKEGTSISRRTKDA